MSYLSAVGPGSNSSIPCPILIGFGWESTPESSAGGYGEPAPRRRRLLYYHRHHVITVLLANNHNNYTDNHNINTNNIGNINTSHNN